MTISVKKISVAVTTLLLLLALAGCGGGSSSGTDNEATPIEKALQETFTTIINTVYNSSVDAYSLCRQNDQITLALLGSPNTSSNILVSFETPDLKVIVSPIAIRENEIDAECPDMMNDGVVDVAIVAGDERSPYESIQFGNSDTPIINEVTTNELSATITIEGANLGGLLNIEFQGATTTVNNDSLHEVTVNVPTSAVSGNLSITTTYGRSNPVWVSLSRVVEVKVTSPVVGVGHNQIDIGMFDQLLTNSNGNAQIKIPKHQPSLLHGMVELADSTEDNPKFAPILYAVVLPEDATVNLNIHSTTVALIWNGIGIDSVLELDDLLQVRNNIAQLNETLSLANYLAEKLADNAEYLLFAEEDVQYIALSTTALTATGKYIYSLINTLDAEKNELPLQQKASTKPETPADTGMGVYGELAKVQPSIASGIKITETGLKGNISLSNKTLLFATAKVTSINGDILRDHPKGYFSGYIAPASSSIFSGILNITNKVGLGDIPEGLDCTVEIITAGNNIEYEPKRLAKTTHADLVSYLKARTAVEKLLWPFLDSLWGLEKINPGAFTKILFNASPPLIDMLGRYFESGDVVLLNEIWAHLLNDFHTSSQISTLFVETFYGVASSQAKENSFIASRLSKKLAKKLGAHLVPVVGQAKLAWEIASHTSNFYSFAGALYDAKNKDSIIDFDVSFPLSIDRASSLSIPPDGASKDILITGKGFLPIVDYTRSQIVDLGDEFKIINPYSLAPEFFIEDSNNFRIDITPNLENKINSDGTRAILTIPATYFSSGAEGPFDVGVYFPSYREVVLIRQNALPQTSIIATDSRADESGDTGEFKITRTGDTRQPLTVHFTLTGSATLNGDYTAQHTSSVIIPANSDSINILITPVSDTENEGIETILLTITENSAYEIASTGDNNATIEVNEKQDFDITISCYKNFSSGKRCLGDAGFNPDSTDIRVFGSMIDFQIAWVGLRVSGVSLANTHWNESGTPYSMSSWPINQNVIGSPLTYGDYTIANAEHSGHTHEPAPPPQALEYDKSYTIIVVRNDFDEPDDYKSSSLSFTLKRPQ